MQGVLSDKFKFYLAVLLLVFTLGAIESIYSALFEEVEDFRYDFLKQQIAQDARIRAVAGADLSVDRSPNYWLYEDSAIYKTTAIGEQARVPIKAKFTRSGTVWVLQYVNIK